ncbi:MAG: hypothetical protein HZY76_08590 [Anaerolineae bacterium]|nr:MAG: hypothetical protein HZY76_08590 [Anaerolineae bacterium]
MTSTWPWTTCHAESNITHALEHNSGASHYHYLLGMVYSAGLRWREAIDALWHALELAPDDDEYLRALGWAVFSSGDEAQGRSLLQEALRVNVSNMVTLTDLALVYTGPPIPGGPRLCPPGARADPHSILAKDVLRAVQLRSSSTSASKPKSLSTPKSASSPDPAAEDPVRPLSLTPNTHCGSPGLSTAIDCVRSMSQSSQATHWAAIL